MPSVNRTSSSAEPDGKKTPVQSKTLSMLDQLRNRYIETDEFSAILTPAGIEILDGFLDNWENIKRFYSQFYGDNFPSTVLCGINPGRNGAGKTGVPFVDFSSLSKLLPTVNRQDTERSAQFFYDIVSHFGPAKFFRSVYVTNVSWVGFKQASKNINYYALPQEAQNFIFAMFKYEMSIASPKRIIALSANVHDTLKEIAGSRVGIAGCLPHPNYCAFPSNYERCKNAYIETLTPFIRA